MLAAAAEAGAAKVLARLTPADDLVSQNEAYRQFGRRTVEAWVAEGLITPQRAGTAENSKRFYSLAELSSLAHAEKTVGMIKVRKSKLLK